MERHKSSDRAHGITRLGPCWTGSSVAPACPAPGRAARWLVPGCSHDHLAAQAGINSLLAGSTVAPIRVRRGRAARKTVRLPRPGSTTVIVPAGSRRGPRQRRWPCPSSSPARSRRCACRAARSPTGPGDVSVRVIVAHSGRAETRSHDAGITAVWMRRRGRSRT